MKKNKRIVFHFAFISFFLLIFSCNKKQNYHYSLYRAITKKDTALLYLSIGKTDFFGQYEIRNGKTAKDSGNVRGKIYGDTLLGDYHYKPYSGGPKKRIPFALLQKDGKLLLGRGVATTYMNIPFYIPEVPITYDNSAFTFIKIHTVTQE